VGCWIVFDLQHVRWMMCHDAKWVMSLPPQSTLIPPPFAKLVDAEDLKHFRASSQKLVAQYNEYRPFPDLALNGQLTLGENIADVAGLPKAPGGIGDH
jgi:hypothetical protein